KAKAPDSSYRCTRHAHLQVVGRNPGVSNLKRRREARDRCPSLLHRDTGQLAKHRDLLHKIERSNLSVNKAQIALALHLLDKLVKVATVCSDIQIQREGPVQQILERCVLR